MNPGPGLWLIFGCGHWQRVLATDDVKTFLELARESPCDECEDLAKRVSEERKRRHTVGA